jgi:hypothetical protein
VEFLIASADSVGKTRFRHEFYGRINLINQHTPDPRPIVEVATVTPANIFHAVISATF